MRWLPWVGRESRRNRNRSAWAEVALRAELKGVGGPAGPWAHGRAILPSRECDLNWAAACWKWDDVRASIRRIADERRQAAAWLLAEQAMHWLHHEVRQQFPELDTEEVYRNDYR